MKRLLLLTAFVLTSVFVFGQNKVMGKLLDGSGDPLIGATIMIDGTTNGTITDYDGSFSLMANEGDVLNVSFIGYENQRIVVGSGADLGMISMSAATNTMESIVVTGVMDIVKDRRTPVAVSTITVDEIQAKSVGNVEFPEVMKNTPSIYVTNQTGFGDAQMFTRGFDQINTAFLLNGQPINGMEDGRMYWSNWSGMSDVASAIQIQRGLGSSNLAISSVGGTVNVVTRTIENEKGGYVRFLTGNDGYMKGTFSYNTGLMNNKFAVSFLVDHWQAENKWAEGTRGQGQNYFLSLGYKASEKSTFNFLVTGAPQWHGNRWSQDSTTLADTPRFNQHFGEYQGEWESERRNFYHKPVINLSWDYDINAKSQLASVLYASFGRGGGTGPWDPKSRSTPGSRIRNDTGGVDFDAIQMNNDTIVDGIGRFNGGNYAIRASMNNHQWFGNVTKYQTSLSDKLDWSAGLDVRLYTGDHFRQFANLLGLDGWQDNFRHATRPDDQIVTESYTPGPWAALFDFAPEEQRIAYDYSEQINYQGVFTQLEYGGTNFSVFGQGALSNQSYQREGRWADQGKSEKVTKIGYNIKTGASYTMQDKHIIFANAGLYSRQPFLDNIFSDIRYSNNLITTGAGEGVDNEEIVGLEAGYKYVTGDLSANVNYYYTTWGNRTNVSVFTNENGTPDDEDDDFAQRTVERGLAQIHSGIELDVEYDLDKLSINAFGSLGNWKFDGVESVQTFNDDTGVELSNESGLDNKGVHVPNAAQTSFGIGVNYDVTNSLDFYVDFNYFDNIYINNINFDSGDQILTEDFGTLDAYSLFDLGVSYRLNIGSNLVVLRGNIYNLLDATYLNQTDAFGFLNGNGRTWNLSAKYHF